MSEYPMVAVASSFQPPVVPQNLEATANSLMESAFDGFGNSLRILKPGKMDFVVVEGGQEVRIPNGGVVGVLLGVAPHNYCTWYERQYNPGQEPMRPDLCWVQHEPDYYPDALPEMYRRKVNIQGQERWGYRIARRTVWALMTVQGDQMYLDLNRPVVLDITSMSLFGKSDTQSHSYRWAGLRGFCDRFSQPGVFQCNPAMFPIQIVIDPQSSVSGVVLFRPQMANGSPCYLDSSTYTAVIEAASSSSVAEMLKVREILTYTPTGAAPVAAPMASPAPAAPMASPAPAAPVAAPMAAPVVAPVAAPAPAAPVAAPVAAPAATPGELLARAADVLGKAAAAQPAAQPAAPVVQPAPQVPQQPQPMAAPVVQPAAASVNDEAKAALGGIMDALGV